MMTISKTVPETSQAYMCVPAIDDITSADESDEILLVMTKILEERPFSA